MIVPQRMKQGVRVVGRPAGALALVVFMVFAAFPLLYMVLLSLKTRAQAFGALFSFTPTLFNYGQVFDNGTFVSSLFNSLLVSVLAVVVGLLVGVPCAYGLARLRFKGRENLAFTILSFKFAPELLIVLPLYVVYQQIGLLNSYVGLVWVYQLIAVPFIVWILRSYFEDIPREVEYAGYVDGYGRWRVFFRVLLPLVRPGLLAAGLLAFIFCWNEYVFPLIVAGSATPMVAVQALNFLGGTNVHYGEVAAAGIVAAIPEVILALALQRYLVRGLSLGAVKA